MTNPMLWALGCAATFALTACSGSDPANDRSAPAVTAGSDLPAATAAPTPMQAATPSDDPSGVSAAALCEYLTGQLPDLRAIGSEVGAMANLTANLFGWFDGQGAVPAGTEIDALTQQQCPDVRAEVLRLAGVDSFTAL